MKKNILACLMLSIIFISTQAQQIMSIKILDETTNQPVSDVNFIYGEKSGTSNEAGEITIQTQPGESIQLSHISYGSWQLNVSELEQATILGIIYKKPYNTSLYPATILALRHGSDKKETLDLDYNDKLSHDGGALLSQIPFIHSIRKSGSYGFDPVLRGFKYDQLNIVIDGAQTATAACPNRMDPPTSQVAPNMLDRIEVFKGPYALRYGNSFGGTINFIPSPPRFSEKPDIYGRMSANYEHNGQIYRGEGLAGWSSNQINAELLASWSQGSDYNDGNGNTVQGQFLRGSMGANVAYRISGRQQISLTGLRNFARDTDFPALPMDLINDDTWMLQGRHQAYFSGRSLSYWKTSAYGTFVEHKMSNLLKPLDPRMMDAVTNATTKTYGGRTEGKWMKDKTNIFAGADLRIEEAEGIRERHFLMGPNAGKIAFDNAWQHGIISNTGFFIEYQQNINDFQLSLSGRADLNQAQVIDAREEYTSIYDETSSFQVNPSFSLGGSYAFNKHFDLSLWLGRAQRSGSLTEKFINYFPVGLDPYEMLGNPNLNPEINNQADFIAAFTNQTTAISINLFAARLQAYISSAIDTSLSPRLPNSPGVRQFKNTGDAFKTGVELTWTQVLPFGLKQQFSAAYTYGQDMNDDEPLPEIAPADFRYTLTGDYLNNIFHPEFRIRHAMQQDRISEAFGETRTPSFTIIDIRLAYHLNKTTRFSVGVDNLLNTAYYEHLTRSVRSSMAGPIYAPGRSFFISMNLTQIGR